MTATDTQPRRNYFYRHSIVVRVTHWVNVLCMTVLLMSGLQIFNAHPALYFGEESNFDNPVLAMGAVRGPDGEPIGVTQIFGATFDTTGFLGLSTVGGRRPAPRGFPVWITLPSYQDLATGRRWHFFFAWLFVINGLVYIVYSLRAAIGASSCRPARSFATSARRSASTSRCASRRARRRVLQCPAEARLFRRHLRPRAAAHPGRA